MMAYVHISKFVFLTKKNNTMLFYRAIIFSTLLFGISPCYPIGPLDKICMSDVWVAHPDHNHSFKLLLRSYTDKGISDAGRRLVWFDIGLDEPLKKEEKIKLGVDYMMDYTIQNADNTDPASFCMNWHTASSTQSVVVIDPYLIYACTSSRARADMDILSWLKNLTSLPIVYCFYIPQKATSLSLKKEEYVAYAYTPTVAELKDIQFLSEQEAMTKMSIEDSSQLCQKMSIAASHISLHKDCPQTLKIKMEKKEKALPQSKISKVTEAHQLINKQKTNTATRNTTETTNQPTVIQCTLYFYSVTLSTGSPQTTSQPSNETVTMVIYHHETSDKNGYFFVDENGEIIFLARFHLHHPTGSDALPGLESEEAEASCSYKQLKFSDTDSLDSLSSNSSEQSHSTLPQGGTSFSNKSAIHIKELGTTISDFPNIFYKKIDFIQSQLRELSKKKFSLQKISDNKKEGIGNNLWVVSCSHDKRHPFYCTTTEEPDLLFQLSTSPKEEAVTITYLDTSLNTQENKAEDALTNQLQAKLNISEERNGETEKQSGKKQEDQLQDFNERIKTLKSEIEELRSTTEKLKTELTTEKANTQKLQEQTDTHQTEKEGLLKSLSIAEETAREKETLETILAEERISNQKLKEKIESSQTEKEELLKSLSIAEETAREKETLETILTAERASSQKLKEKIDSNQAEKREADIKTALSTKEHLSLRGKYEEQKLKVDSITEEKKQLEALLKEAVAREQKSKKNTQAQTKEASIQVKGRQEKPVFKTKRAKPQPKKNSTNKHSQITIIKESTAAGHTQTTIVEYY